MSGRQYGITPGHRPSRSSEDSRAPESPMRNYVPSQSHELQDYNRHSSVTPGSRLSNPFDSRHDLSYEPGPPAPPPHRSGPSPPTRHERHHSNHGGYAAGAGAGAFGGAAAYDLTNVSSDRVGNPLNDIDNLYSSRMMSPSPEPEPDMQPAARATPSRPPAQPAASQSGRAPFMAFGQPQAYDPSTPYGASPYRNDGYDNYFDPQDIADDGDDGLEERPRQRSSRFGRGTAVGAGAGGGAAAGAAGAAAGGAFGSRDASGNYGPVPGGGHEVDPEKSEWLRGQSSGKKRLRWIIGIILLLVIVGAIVGGVLGGVVFNNSGDDDGSDGASRHSDKNGLYDIDSSEVKKVLNNNDLHKVFPGMDYTPQGAQYPACLTDSPSQNDVTLDVAILAQLTPAIRLYGTDCNQTELVLTAIDRLNYNDTVKVWLGVWLGNNQTTNDRQLDQMYDILDVYPSSHFAGIIIGNEVLFREDLTISELGDVLASTRKNLTARDIDLPVATSDLGDDWTSALAADSDIVMANVHPLFAGVKPDEAPGWTWSFWMNHNVPLAQDTGDGKYPKNIIAETGWPSEGGNNCGTGEKCPDKTSGAVAGIDELNEFMEGWVCPSLKNGTTYFWFEAYDEPWKKIFNDAETGDFWEPHWGLLDVERNLKDGIKIPDCDGQTVDKPY